MKLSHIRQGALIATMALSAACVSAAPVQTFFYLNAVDLTLTDLNPADGLEPSLTLAPGSVFSLFVSPGSGGYETSKSSGPISGNIYDLSSGSLALDGDMAVASKFEEIQHVVTNLDQNLLSDTNLSRLMQNQASQDIYAQVKAYSYFTLGAHSKVTFLTQLQLAAGIDTTAVGDLTFLQSHPDQQVTLQGISEYSAFAMDSNGHLVGTNTNADGYWTYYASTKQVFQAGNTGTLTPTSNQKDGWLAMDISNDSDVALEFSLNSIAYGSASVSVTSVVPEPGTWALMVLGLVGITAARRRSA